MSTVTVFLCFSHLYCRYTHHRAFTNCYTEDVVEFGDPKDSGVTTVVPQDISALMVGINNEAQCIEYVPGASDSDSMTGPAKKRKRTG